MANKSPRRAYNPGRRKRAYLTRKAQYCFLYRWDLMDEEPNAYYSSGNPGYEKIADEVMNWAMHQTLPWQAIVVAAFVDQAGEYYEELVQLPRTEPFQLAKHFMEMQELVTEGKAQAVSGGNPNHFVDTMTILYPYSDRLATQLDKTAVIEESAGRRAQYIFDTFPELELRRYVSA